MKKVKKIKLNKNGKIFLMIICLVLLISLTPFCIKLYKTSTLKKLSYDKTAIKAILDKKLYKEIKEVGYNETINYIVGSKDFNEKNINKYQKIDYVKQEDLCKNINLLISKGYTTKEINLIVKNSTNEVLNEFVKKDYIENISSYLKYDYAKTRNIDRYVNYYNETMESYDNVVTFVNIGLDQEFYTNSSTVDTYSETVLVNKYVGVSEKYKPKNLVSINKKFWVDNEKQQAAEIAAKAFEEMAEDALKDNMHILANSTYRSYEVQEDVFNTYKDLYGDNYALKYAAKAGFSEHQTGLVIDIAARDSNIFANSKESTWVYENAHKYGFIQRYPKGKENITGYKYEAWHYRYVGKKIAKYIYDNDLTYDEYYYRFLDKEK